ncbi:hypothetical protein CDL15_Pgr005379 [Punica granatum]|uniref:Uncharacterized protein n=1 Tax=Punica granatum TaxID=22663 RepID=A0A218XE60_PUNGR|nr:hypothetical protein CDL15_Pgr005379 [Punica granatum]
MDPKGINHVSMITSLIKSLADHLPSDTPVRQTRDNLFLYRHSCYGGQVIVTRHQNFEPNDPPLQLPILISPMEANAQTLIGIPPKFRSPITNRHEDSPLGALQLFLNDFLFSAYQRITSLSAVSPLKCS